MSWNYKIGIFIKKLWKMIINYLIFLELYFKKSKDYIYGNFRYLSIIWIYYDY